MLWRFSDSCKSDINDEIAKGNSPQVIIVSECLITDIINPFNNKIITKEDLGYLVAVVDIIVVITMVLFVYFLEKSQKRYIEQFKDQTIEMTDFAVSIKNLPPDYMWNHDEHVLKAYLRAHFEAVIKDYMLKNNLEITKILDSSNFDKNGYNKYEIVDICFGKSDMSELSYLDKMADLRNKFLLHNIKMERCKD